MTARVVLVSGALTRPDRTYATLAAELAERHLEPTAIPWGPAWRSADTLAAYGVADEARLVEDHLDHFDGPVSVVGHSCGCLAAILFALARPHRVTSLTLVDIAWLGNRPRWPGQAEFTAEMDRIAALPPARVGPAFAAAFSPPGPRPASAPAVPPPELGRLVTEARVGWTSWRRDPLEPELDRLTMPVHLPFSTSSPTWMRAVAVALAARLPNATSSRLPGTHLNVVSRNAGRIASWIHRHVATSAGAPATGVGRGGPEGRAPGPRSPIRVPTPP
ncbi:alpha/beta fold hydrolase [Actinoalloteichus caeruleus]|uniref:Lipase n=1 Tax=Actinoalloteichus caeruleus DSM 43889 TaxID=1120930 RepID=A0ABT1JJV5_ACTCY|nr:alpha/beta fold hydrolase [Actinoalloteichus caeruleus]MCP2332767.1 lipase [Actinoalloteichus caeruleus DSM 43889]